MKLILSTLMIFSLLNNGLARAEGTIVGGQLVKSGDRIARRTVGLVMVGSDGSAGTCTGAILSKGAILTAAHCVAGAKNIFVVFSINGVMKIVQDAAQTKPFQPNGRNYRFATNFRQLKGYSGQQGGDDEFSDLAVVTFAGGLPMGYETAKFLNQAEGGKLLTAGAPVVVAGYGITSVNERDNPTASGPRSSGTLRQVSLQFDQFSAGKKNMFLEGQNRNACSGDSGGPALVSAGGEVYVVGVASRSNCVTSSIYTWVPRERATRVYQIVHGAY